MNTPDRSAKESTSSSAAAEAARPALLRVLAGDPAFSQRQHSVVAGLVLRLGTTHHVLRTLLGRCLPQVPDSRPGDNKLRCAHLLAWRGLHESLRSTRAFLAPRDFEHESLRRVIPVLRREPGDRR